MEMERLIEKINKREPTILGSENFRTYGILVPMIKVQNEIHLVFEVRSMELRRQPGEICFPGGKVDETDMNPKEAAIRETTEELGIDRNSIEQVYPLDYFIQPIEGRIIYPFVGIVNYPEKINPNPSEVKEIFTVPLSYLLKTEPEIYSLDFQVKPNENFPFHLIPGGKNYRWQTRKIEEAFYFYKDYCIWGLTAKILQNFLSKI